MPAVPRLSGPARGPLLVRRILTASRGAPGGERPAHDRGDLRHHQRLWPADMTGPERGGQRRPRPLHAVAGQPAVLTHRTAFPGCGELAALSSRWLLAASLAPVWVRCHHAGCMITC